MAEIVSDERVRETLVYCSEHTGDAQPDVCDDCAGTLAKLELLELRRALRRLGEADIAVDAVQQTDLGSPERRNAYRTFSSVIDETVALARRYAEVR